MTRDWKDTISLPSGVHGPPLDVLNRLMAEGRPFHYEAENALRALVAALRGRGTGHWGAHLWIGQVPKAKRPLCGARTRKGTPCQARCVDGRERCRLHGGLSTGPRTAEGREAIAESNRRRAERRREEKAAASA